jgi:hypothetical protein
MGCIDFLSFPDVQYDEWSLCPQTLMASSAIKNPASSEIRGSVRVCIVPLTHSKGLAAKLMATF